MTVNYENEAQRTARSNQQFRAPLNALLSGLRSDGIAVGKMKQFPTNDTNWPDVVQQLRGFADEARNDESPSQRGGALITTVRRGHYSVDRPRGARAVRDLVPHLRKRRIRCVGWRNRRRPGPASSR